ncbi:MAG TPA: glycoside hydrolase family 30 beta sandwich domain-containing protein [Candidatus Limnocylindrales bacterium]|nr:glycoside hydrolase family 30 beta sandwich domain-containing protein [Candidatus Limnocylindrales bacterium]
MGLSWVMLSLSFILLSIPASAQVEILLDNTMTYQIMEGFGATHQTLMLGNKDTLTPAQRLQAVDALFNQVRITTGQVPNLFEAPAHSSNPFRDQANDNKDPFDINWKGFHSAQYGDLFKQKVMDLAPPEALNGLYPATQISTRWGAKWLGKLGVSDYNRYLNECAEQVLAGIIYWKNKYGKEPRYAHLFNEPTSGNRELDPITDAQAVVDIIKGAGNRLRKAGFNRVKFVVPNEETEKRSLEVAAKILADPEARQYVGVLGYHPYPYGSPYAYIPNLLKESGTGHPNPEGIQLRRQLRNLAEPYKIPLWMTEVSHGYFMEDHIPATAFDALRGRAIHIHDELVYAHAAGFFGMNSMWDSTIDKLHFEGNRSKLHIWWNILATRRRFGSDPPQLLTRNIDTIVLIDTDHDKVYITGMGYAIGHYARWIRRGAIRIEGKSSDPLVQVTSFRDDNQGRIVLVLINNAPESKMVKINLRGIALTGSLVGEQSTVAAYWKPLEPFSTTTPTAFNLTLPAESVTTVAGQIGGLSNN